jgi:hypothetical protein
MGSGDAISENLVLVEFLGQPLALPQAAFLEALRRGRELLGTQAPTPTSKDDTGLCLLTAEEMEERTKVPATWFLEQAR